MVAHHQGIFGLGCLLTIGAATGLASSLLVLPALLRVLRPRMSPRREEAGVARSTSQGGIS
jgi:predicted RND superfamily exporter protein